MNSSATGVSATRLTRSLLLVFALPGILQAFMLAPSTAILQGVYAKESGIALTVLGSAIIAVRVFDFFSDLLIGYLSDRSAQRGVSRKLWIAVGTVVSAVALWFLFRPPPQVTVSYYMAWFLLANIGWSLVEIPYRSWSLEFSADPAERTRIVTWIAVAGLIGGLLFYGVAPLGKALGWLESSEIDLRTLGLTAIIVVLLLPPLSFYSLLRVPDGKGGLPAAPRLVEPAKESLSVLFASVFRNGPLLQLLGCLAIFHFMSGLQLGVTLLYLTNYLGLSSSVNAVFALAIPLSLVGIPMWGALIVRYNRKRVWAIGMALTSICHAGMGVLPPLPSVALLTALFCLATFFALSSLVAGPVIMGDIIDHGRRKFGVERGGLYLSLHAQVIKGVGAVAAGAGLIMLGWAGFDASKSGAELTPQAVTALKWVVAWLPSLGQMTAALLLWFLPMTGANSGGTGVDAR